jgi:hypothetical protein
MERRSVSAQRWTYNACCLGAFGTISECRRGAASTTTFGIDPVPLIEEATRLEFAGGVKAKLGGGVSLYAQAGYQFAPDSAFIRNGIQGDIGLRHVW